MQMPKPLIYLSALDTNVYLTSNEAYLLLGLVHQAGADLEGRKLNSGQLHRCRSEVYSLIWLAGKATGS